MPDRFSAERGRVVHVPDSRANDRAEPAATPEQLAVIRAKAAAAEGVFVADMPAAAQLTRVYDEYLDTVAVSSGDALPYYSVSVVGPRNRVDRIVGRLALL